MALSSSHIAAIRKDYQLAALEEDTVGDQPLAFFAKWFTEAQARIVLLKGTDDQGFLFFTNYQSSKGRELQANPYASLVFFWQELERQVRVEGAVERLSDLESSQYFHSRPEGSKLGAWASPQSQPIPSRRILDNNYRLYSEKFAITDIPRPPHWGGYRVVPERVEFWQGRSNRLHDRIVFLAGPDGWQKQRLAP